MSFLFLMLMLFSTYFCSIFYHYARLLDRRHLKAWLAYQRVARSTIPHLSPHHQSAFYQEYHRLSTLYPLPSLISFLLTGFMGFLTLYTAYSFSHEVILSQHWLFSLLILGFMLLTLLFIFIKSPRYSLSLKLLRMLWFLNRRFEQKMFKSQSISSLY